MVGGDANIELPREIDGTSVLFTGRQDQSEGQVSFTREVGCRSHATPISSSEARGPSPLIGIDHVGISSDFNHGGGVIGLMGADETLNCCVEAMATRTSPSSGVRTSCVSGRTSSIWGAAKGEPDHPR